METARSLQKENIKMSQVSFWLMIILFILRYPLLFFGEMGIVPLMVAFVVYLVATYFFTGLFIYLNRANLQRYNITNVALLVFLGAPLLALIAGNDDDLTIWIRLIIAIGFAVLLFVKRKDWFQNKTIRISQIIASIIFTAVLCVVLPLVIHAIKGFPVIEPQSNRLDITFDIPYVWFFQLSSAAISEEPLFRGILWGYLRTKGIKDIWICAIQAALFWVGHIYYAGTGINFWIIHPLVALLLGIVVWKAKSISHSMALHACVNTFADYLRHLPYL